jgi:hypothetical protein
MNPWVGLGVIADNVVNIGRAMEKQAALITPAHRSRYAPPLPWWVLRCQAAVDHNAESLNFAPGSS